MKFNKLEDKLLGWTIVNRTATGVGMMQTDRGSVFVFDSAGQCADMAARKGVPGKPEEVYFKQVMLVLPTGDGYAFMPEAARRFNQALRDNRWKISELFPGLPLVEISVVPDRPYHVYDYRVGLPPALADYMKQSFVQIINQAKAEQN